MARELGTMSPVTAEDELIIALTTVRATYGVASVSEDDLRDIVATEESRVADAAVVAELLASRMSALPPPTVAQASAPTGSASPLPTPIPFPTVNSASPISVADLIEGMLVKERRDVRKPANG